MASKREPSPSLRMRKIALVICEGETEVCYINLLKSWYKGAPDKPCGVGRADANPKLLLNDT